MKRPVRRGRPEGIVSAALAEHRDGAPNRDGPLATAIQEPR